MKRLILIFFLLPFHSFACDCNPPPVALEFLRSEYVFGGSVVDKKYAEDSLTYTVTLNIKKHFKENKEHPETLTFTKAAEGIYTGKYTSCDYSVNKGQNWLVYAYEQQGKLTFHYYCSNSSPYRTLYDASKRELAILETGNEIDINKIVFQGSSVGSLYREYQGPAPTVPLDSLLARLNPENYERLKAGHFEGVVVSLDKKGHITDIVVPKRGFDINFKDVYDIKYAVYEPTDTLTELQKDIVEHIKQAKRWVPATFLGENVSSQTFLRVSFDRGKKPTASPAY